MIAIAVIVVMLACVTAVLSGGGPWVFGVDGMPRPDGDMILRDPGQPPITYNAKSRADGSILIRRNGVPWITLANTKTAFLLSDPNGSRQTVIKFEHGGSYGRSEPVKLRAPAP